MGFLLTSVPRLSSPLPSGAAVLPQAANRYARCLRGTADQCGSLPVELLSVRPLGSKPSPPCLSCARSPAVLRPSLWAVSARSQNRSFAETSGLNQGRSKYGPQNRRILFPLRFEKDHAILSRTKAPFCKCSCHLRVTVVRVGVDRTTSCTDGSQCRSARLLAISHCSTQPLAQPGVWFQVRAPATRSVVGARCRRLHSLWHEQGTQ